MRLAPPLLSRASSTTTRKRRHDRRFCLQFALAGCLQNHNRRAAHISTRAILAAAGLAKDQRIQVSERQSLASHAHESRL